MKAARFPKAYIEALSADMVLRYLDAHGWEQASVREPNEVVVYRYTDRPEVSVLIPLTDKYADHLHRIADAIFLAAEVEDRPFWEVYMDMAGRYYVGPHTYSTTPQTNGSANGAAKHTDAAEVT